MITGKFGIWTRALGMSTADAALDAARDIERLGFTSIWIGESNAADPFVVASLLLSATDDVSVCTGVARIHARVAQSMSNTWSILSAWYPGRFVLGLGVSHRRVVEGNFGQSYESPLAQMDKYLTQLADAEFDGPHAARKSLVLAALGPKMLGLARDRANGAHPYLAPAAHTAYARDILGPEPWLVPEVKVLFEEDRTTARALARAELGPAFRSETYGRNLIRSGFDPEDVAAGADAVVDSLVLWGTDDEIAAGVQAHLDAGANQVTIQVLSPNEVFPREGWRRLAAVLT